MIKRGCQVSKIVALDILIDHLLNKVELTSFESASIDDDIHSLKCILLQYANANSALTLGYPLIPFELRKSINNEVEIVEVEIPYKQVDDLSLAMRFFADALKIVLDVDYGLLMSGKHYPIDLTDLINSWGDYVRSIEPEALISLKDTVTQLSIETFSSVVHKPVPYTLHKDVAQELYVNKMAL